MNVYLDTDIVVADAVQTHARHADAASLIEHVLRRHSNPVISAHGLAEAFAVLTRTPFPRRVSPAEAWQILQENVLQLFEVQSLSRSDYTEVVRQCAAQGLAGDQIFDALHILAARKAHCSRIYTFNVEDFRRVAPDLHARILRP